MYQEKYNDKFIQDNQLNNYQQNHKNEYENAEYKFEYDSDNQFQPETKINPDLSISNSPNLFSITPNSNQFGYNQSKPNYEPHYEFNYDTKTMTEEEKSKLKLHQGSVIQFSEKNPNPNYKNELAEYSHIDEASKYMIPKSTVAQFPEKNPNPNYKNELAEYSHIDESTKYLIQKPTVQQFTNKVPDFKHLKNLPQKPHIHEEEEYNKKLQLHQGSVLQQPKHAEYEKLKKYYVYRPKQDSLKEEMPLARIPNPEHLLPSQVKKMQTYITHPTSKSIKSIGFTNSAPSSPTFGRKNNSIWPPINSQIRLLPRTGFNPNVMYNDDSRKQFIWPPQCTNNFGSLNDIRPVPTIGSGPAANAWHPDINSTHTNSILFNLQQRLHIAWPPNQTGNIINTNNNSERVCSVGQSDEYVRHKINPNIPITYKTPPGTQFYKVPYSLENENNNKLHNEYESNFSNLQNDSNEKFYDIEQYDIQQKFEKQQKLEQQQKLEKQHKLEQQKFEQQQFKKNNTELNNILSSEQKNDLNEQCFQNKPYYQEYDQYTEQQQQFQQQKDFFSKKKQNCEPEIDQLDKQHISQDYDCSNQIEKNNNSIFPSLKTQQLFTLNNYEQLSNNQQKNVKSSIYRSVSPQLQKNIYQQFQPQYNTQQNYSQQNKNINDNSQYLKQKTSNILHNKIEKQYKQKIEMQHQYYIQQ